MNSKYTELDVWQKGRFLVKSIYIMTRKFPKEELFILTQQMRRAVVSIPANIAEGLGRNSAKDTLNFLFIANGSANELETQPYLCLDLEYIDLKLFETKLEEIITVKKLLAGFINYFEKLAVKGTETSDF
jgi:four helix bundle protein